MNPRERLQQFLMEKVGPMTQRTGVVIESITLAAMDAPPDLADHQGSLAAWTPSSGVGARTGLGAMVRHAPAPNLRGLGLPQGVARALVVAAVALFLNTNSTLAARAIAVCPLTRTHFG